ncbi:MAG: hypothetical protein ACXWLM_09400 [Myxococcales bacterium]
MSSKLPESFDWITAAGDGAAVEAEVPAGYAPTPWRRLLGDGFANLIAARAEVEATLREGGGAIPAAPPLADAVPADEIPSVALGRREDRILAEIDQDGFAFAVDPVDAPYFDRRVQRRPRPQNFVHVALVEGRVCIRKEFRELRLGARRWGGQRVPVVEWLRRKVWATLGLYLYNEAAALLRLQDLPFVPHLRRIDFAEQAIYLDCIAGESLRHQAASAGAPVHDQDLGGDSALQQLTARELDRREVKLLDAVGLGGHFRREIAVMTREINARGVAPLDIKLGNFIRGAATGGLYWIDFEISRLASQPRWEEDLAQQHEMLAALLD